jgi:glutathione S-transferase
MTADTRPVLGYWAIRGLAQPIRYLLAYAGVNYKEVLYQKPNEAEGTNEWLDVKEKLREDYPLINLPYYQDEQVKLTQSMAILQYLAKKYLPSDKSDAELARIDMVAFEARDVRWMDPKSERVGHLVNYLGDQKWICGDFSYADVMFYEMIIHLWRKDEQIYQRFPTLEEYVKRFENIPNIKKYFELNGVVNEWTMTLRGQ